MKLIEKLADDYIYTPHVFDEFPFDEAHKRKLSFMAGFRAAKNAIADVCDEAQRITGRDVTPTIWSENARDIRAMGEEEI